MTECKQLTTAKTPFNPGGRDVAVTGMMFDIEAKTRSITIRTVEVNARVRSANGNLGIEVWISNESAATAYNDPSAWQQIVSKPSQLVANPDPNMGAIIPAWEFTSFTMPANSKRAIYMRMRDRYLDNTQRAEVGPGDPAVLGRDLNVYAGWYVTAADPTFPSTQQTDTSPIFAGVFHYDLLYENCADRPLVETQVKFQIAIDRSLQVNDYRKVQDAAYETFETLLSKDAKLKEMVKNYGLVQKTDGVIITRGAYSGVCPVSWFRCESVDTAMTFLHSQDLPGGEVQVAMSQHYLSIAQEQLKVMPDATKVSYVGYVDSKANFEMELVGVSQSKEMDAAQIRFLQDEILKHLQRKTQSITRVRVFTVEVELQSLSDFDSVSIQGRINGAIIAVFNNNEFATEMKNALNNHKAEFLSFLQFNMNYPGAMAQEKRYEFFAGVSDMPRIDVRAWSLTRAPTPAPTNAKNYLDDVSDVLKDNFDMKYMGYIAAGIGVIALLIIACCTCRYMAKNRRLEAEREERRNERRQRSLLKINVESDDDDDDEPVDFPKKTQKPGLHDDDDVSFHSEKAPASTRRMFGVENKNTGAGSSRSFDHASHSDRFMDEVSENTEDDKNIRPVANIYSLGGFGLGRAPPKQQQKRPSNHNAAAEPRGPHARDGHVEDLLDSGRTGPSSSTTPKESGKGDDLETQAASGNLFGSTSTEGGISRAAFGRKPEPKSNMDQPDGDSSHHDSFNMSERDLRKSSSSKHKKKKRSKSMSAADQGGSDKAERRKSSSHGRSSSSKNVKHGSGNYDMDDSKRSSSGKSSSRRKSLRAGGSSRHEDDPEHISESKSGRKSH